MPTKKSPKSPITEGRVRALFLCNRCEKWKDFNQGHTMRNNRKEGDACAPDCVDCWHIVQQKILLFILKKQWRLETTITSYICKVEPTWTMERVIDELFKLVKEAKIEWSGAEDSLARPLKYRYLSGLPQYKDNAVNLTS